MKYEKPPRNRVLQTVRRFLTNPIFKIILVIIFLLFIFMSIILFSEKSVNDKFKNYFDVMWFTVVSMTTTGYGDVTPITVAGKITAMTLLLFGVVSVGAVSGKIASALFQFNLKKEKGLVRLKNMRKQFVICGWKPDFDLILEGILSANPGISLERIVLVNTAASEHMEKILSDERFTGITYVSGDFTDETSLLRANIKNAERVLIVSDSSQNFSPLETDSRTVMGVLTVENLNPKAYVAAELIDSKFERHLSVAHCDEIILSTEYERNLLVSASSGTGISHVLRGLVGKNADEGLVIENILPELTGKTFAEIKEFYCSAGKSSESAPIPIGVLENTGNFVERRREALTEAQKNPDVASVISNMKKVKLLKSNNPILAPDSSYVPKAGSKVILVYNNRTAFKPAGGAA